MDRISALRSELSGQDLTFLAETQYVYHCHHFNLFHDQTVEDALGEEAGQTLKVNAARAASRRLLSGLVRGLGAETPAERLEIASSVFAAMGQGKLALSAQPGGGSARGEYLHYSWSWREKYGQRVRREEPIDAFAAGFAAAATEVAYDLAPASIEARETACYVRRDPACEFELRPSGSSGALPAAGERELAALVGPSFAGWDEERIAAIAGGLKQFVAGVGGDARGLVQAFGVYVTCHLAEYYNETAYGAIHAIEKTRPQAASLVEELFGESGHVCVFNTFGNILLSPEWEGMVGPLSGDIADTVAYCCAIARGLGFGHWAIAELQPHQRLVLRASSNYEAPYYQARFGRSAKPRSYFFANAARAIMQLAHRVDWKSRPQLTQELYESLFKSGLSWRIEQTRCLTQGHEHCEVVVSRAS